MEKPMASDGEQHDEETTAEIIDRARAADIEITHDQLERWHRAGAIPVPRQTPLGPRGGSVTLYPNGSGTQAIAVARGLMQTRRLDEVAFALWLPGAPVAISLVRTFLSRVARWHDRLVDSARAVGFGHVELPDPALDLLSRVAHKHAEGPGMRSLWQRLGERGDRETLVRIVMDAAVGTYVPTPSPSTSTYERESEGLLVERAVGIENGRTEPFLDIGPWLSGKPEEALELMPALVAGQWVDELRELSDDDLEHGRSSCAAILELATGLSASFTGLFGEEAFGVGNLAILLKERTAFLDGFILLALTRASRQPDLAARMAVLIGALPDLHALQELVAQAPALRARADIGDLLTPDALRAAFSDRDMLEVHAAAIDERSTQLRADGVRDE